MENPQAIETPLQQKALKRDSFDRSAANVDRTIDMLQSEAALVSSVLLSATSGVGYLESACVASLAFGFVIGDVPRSFAADFLADNNEKKESSEDSELGYRTKDLVYQSQEPLVKGGIELKKGSNMISYNSRD